MNEFPADFSDVVFPEWKIVFVLVIRRHKREWLPDVAEVLNRELKALRTIMNVEIAVFNEEIAIKRGLASDDHHKASTQNSTTPN